MNARLLRVLLVSGAIGWVPLVAAQPLAAAETGERSEAHWSQMVTLSMRDADLRSIVQWIAEQTGKQVVLDPRVQGKVSLISPEPMTIAQAYAVFLAMLDVYGYAATDLDGILRIYPAPLARTSAKEVIESFADPTRGGQVMYVLSPDNVTPQALVDLIKPLLGPAGYAAAVADTNAIVIADSRDQVQRLAELAQRVDRRGTLDVEVVKLERATAEAVAATVTELMGGAGEQPTGRTNEARTMLAVVADRRSNSVLLSGNDRVRQQARELVRRLDAPVVGAGTTRVVYLRYLSAEEMTPILQRVTRSVQEEAASGQIGTALVAIEASKSTNALVLSGPPLLLDEMEKVVEQLDVRRAQVLVEAVIVEVTTDLGQQLGVQWNTDLSGDGVQAATRFGPQAVGDELLSILGSGLTLGYYRHGSLRALINALATSSHANILSTPSVMTLDNQPAEIMVGSNIPLITGQATGTAAEVDNPFTTIEREDIGVILKITPQINHDDAVTLDIVQEVETVAEVPAGSSLTGARDLVTDKRSVATKVLVDNDTVVVLGGLISDEDQEVVSKVPVLGDMPLVGRLFRSTSTRRAKRNLMVFIRPVIVDSGEIAQTLTRRAYEAMRGEQQRMASEPATGDMGKVPVLPEFEEFRPRTRAESSPP